MTRDADRPSLTVLPPTDTRLFFSPVAEELSALLRMLSDDAWTKPAVGTWQVRDVVAHLIDIGMRRLAFHRDGHTPPPPPFPIEGERDFVRFINQINADWVVAARRLSTRQLTDLYASCSAELAAFVESLPLEGPGLFGVSWAGEMASPCWFDIGREFTEQWHHQRQIREAVSAPPMPESLWLRATLLIALRGLPHAYRAHDAGDGATLALHLTGDGGVDVALQRANGAWQLLSGTPAAPSARVSAPADALCKLLFNGLDRAAAADAFTITGDAALAAPLFEARSIVV